MGCHALLQGIFLTQRSNLRLLHLLCCKRILHHQATREAPTPKAGGEFGEGALDWSQGGLLLGDGEPG